jgi:hypothetical protein
VPARLQKVVPPIVEPIHAADLIRWKGAVSDPSVVAFVQKICERLGRAAVAPGFVIEELMKLPALSPLPEFASSTVEGPGDEQQRRDHQAIASILSKCHRRSVYTRMHAQLNRKAMFASIETCVGVVTSQISEISCEYLRQEVFELQAALENILRKKNKRNAAGEINIDKLAALQSFWRLAEATNGSYPLPSGGKACGGLFHERRVI